MRTFKSFRRGGRCRTDASPRKHAEPNGNVAKKPVVAGSRHSGITTAMKNLVEMSFVMYPCKCETANRNSWLDLEEKCDVCYMSLASRIKHIKQKVG